MRCPDCDYDLRGLPENRCPECGRPFDPADPRTFKLAEAPPKRSSFSACIHVAFMVLWVAVGFFQLVPKDGHAALWQIAGWTFGGAALSSLAGSRAKDVVISWAILAAFLDACLIPNCGPGEWYVGVIVPAALAVLLFAGFYLWRLVRVIGRPD